MNDMRIRFRIGSEYDGDPDTKQFRDATFAEAFAALQGEHDPSGYHRDIPVYVVNTHAETHTVEGDGRQTRTVTYQQGEPKFGERVTIYGRQVSFRETWKDAHVSWASGGSMSTVEARNMLTIMTLATNLAEAANAEPICSQCAKEIAARKARWVH